MTQFLFLSFALRVVGKLALPAGFVLMDNFKPLKLVLAYFYLLLGLLVVPLQLRDPIVHQLLSLLELPGSHGLLRQIQHVLVHLLTQVRVGGVVRPRRGHTHARLRLGNGLAEVLSGRSLVFGQLRL